MRSVLTPDYQRDGVTLYLGDAIEIVPQLGTVAAVVTDPPYGIGKWSANATGGFMTRAKAKECAAWDVAPTPGTLLSLAERGRTVIWGANYLGLPAWRTPLVWDKDQQGMHFAEVEIAWTNFDFGSARILHCPIKQEETFGHKRHPTQKPIAVMAWSIRQTRVPTGSIVLDPYLGSGTTAIAAVRLGCKAIGVEMCREYFDIAVKRIDAELRQGRLPFKETANGQDTASD